MEQQSRNVVGRLAFCVVALLELSQACWTLVRRHIAGWMQTGCAAARQTRLSFDPECVQRCSFQSLPRCIAVNESMPTLVLGKNGSLAETSLSSAHRATWLSQRKATRGKRSADSSGRSGKRHLRRRQRWQLPSASCRRRTAHHHLEREVQCVCGR